MWIEPAQIDLTEASVGMRFNVTIWLNMTTLTNSWEFYLVYSKEYVQALRCQYTGNGKSLWAGSYGTNAIEPNFGNDSADVTRKYVVHAETLKSSANQTGAGSLSWVEFNVTKLPSNVTGTPITGELRLDVVGWFDSFAMDAALNKLRLSFSNATYTIPEFTLSTLLFAFSWTVSLILILVRRARRRLS
jgi:hypothetical protein